MVVQVSLDDTCSTCHDLVSILNATATLTSDLAGIGHLSVGGGLSGQDLTH